MSPAGQSLPNFRPASPVFCYKCAQNSDGSISPSGVSSDGEERSSAQFSTIELTDGCFYFEVVIKACEFPILGLGFAPPEYKTGMCGWYNNSCGFHADDGGLFDADGSHTAAANYCTVGDVMGIGWVRKHTVKSKVGEIFFVKNGKRLFNCDGVIMRNPSTNLVPTVSVDLNPEISFIVNTHGPFFYQKMNALLPR
ncbi:hypothetical protein GEMRC1_013759 [Eukaryota sp. GEM-RC1]